MSGPLYRLDVAIKDSASPEVAKLLRVFDRAGGGMADFMKVVAAKGEDLTRRHILEAATTRHTTATRLGATPTGYLAKRANAIESVATGDTATIRLGGAPEIFARAFGDVVVKPVLAKKLTIPLIAEAYGKRAREIPGLFPVRTKRGNALLMGRDGKQLKAYYLLKDSVRLPQDRGLLPSDEDYRQMVGEAATDFIKLIQS